MDHAIDRANRCVSIPSSAWSSLWISDKSRRLGVLGASYVFAALEESNYLANSINAHLTCVNQVPTELLGRTPHATTEPSLSSGTIYSSTASKFN